MSFQNIHDQEVAIRLLSRCITRDRIPNALMFWGPAGVGKQTTAMEMAKAVNCASGAAGPCDACLSCRKVMHGNHPDVQVVAPLKRSRIIDVETIDSINEFASLRPFESKWRVFVLVDADRLKGPAQNHFLKTLEEPAGRSLFILVTEHPRMLLPTIRSRCQMVRFGTLRPETVIALLRRERDIPEPTARSIAALAQGQMSRALDLVDTERRAVALNVIFRLRDGDDPLAVAEAFGARLAEEAAQVEAGTKAEFETTDEFSREDKERLKDVRMAVTKSRQRRDMIEYLYLFGTWYRDELVYRTTNDMRFVLNKDQAERLDSVSTRDMETIAKKLAALEKARVYLERFIKEDRVFRDLFFVLAD